MRLFRYRGNGKIDHKCAIEILSIQTLYIWNKEVSRKKTVFYTRDKQIANKETYTLIE